MASLSPSAKQQFFTDAGAPAAGCSLYTYATGTATPLATYTDKAGSVANANPIVLDARGECIIYLLPQQYRYVLKDSLGSTIWTRDNVSAGVDLADLTGSGSGQGASLVGFIQSGTGAVARTVQDKARERISVEDFGAVGDGVVDDTAAFLAARDYAASIGGANIDLCSRKYLITSEIAVTQSNIKFRGIASWTNHDVGATAPGTWIVWGGASGGTVFSFIPVEGASNQRGTGGGLIDVAFGGQNVADNALVVKSWTNGEFRVFGANFNRTIVEVGVVTTLGEARDAQFNDFWIFGRQITSPVSPSTLIIGGLNTATSGANTSFNRFHEISSNYLNGTALDLYDSDSNWFGTIRLNSGAGGTGKGMVWHAGTGVVGANTSSCRGNYFQMLSVGAGGFFANGTESGATASSGAVAWWDSGNSAPTPTVGTGAVLSLSYGGITGSFTSSYRANISDNLNNAAVERANVGTESLRISNGSSNHVRLTDGATVWGVYLTGGNLRFKVIQGTGTFSFGSWTGSSDYPINGFITILDANGTSRRLATIA